MIENQNLNSKRCLVDFKTSLEFITQFSVLENKPKNYGIKSSLKENFLFNLKSKNSNFCRQKLKKSPETNCMTDLLRGNFLAKMGEKVTFLVALKNFFKKEQTKKDVLLVYKPFFLVGMKTNPPDLKLVSRALLKKITRVSFSAFKSKEGLRADLLVFFFQIRKWAGCYQILLNSTNSEKGYHSFLLTRISILLKVFKERKKNKMSKLKKKKMQDKIISKSPIRNFICTGEITQKRKEFTASRHFLFWVVKTGSILKMLEGYESLTKTGISKVIRIEPFSILVCEEIVRIETILKKISGTSQKKNFEWDFVKKKIIKNSDELFQKMLIQGKIGKLII